MATDVSGDGTATWRTGRTIAGALGLLFSGFYLVEGRELSMGTMDAPGPGIYPVAVGVLLALASLAVIVEAQMTKAAGAISFPTGANARRLLAVFFAFVLYVLLLQVVGFPVATALFVAFYVRVVGKISWLWTIVSGVAVAAGVWVVFALLLSVQLPQAIWS